MVFAWSLLLMARCHRQQGKVLSLFSLPCSTQECIATLSASQMPGKALERVSRTASTPLPPLDPPQEQFIHTSN